MHRLLTLARVWEHKTAACLKSNPLLIVPRHNMPSSVLEEKKETSPPHRTTAYYSGEGSSDDHDHTRVVSGDLRFGLRC